MGVGKILIILTNVSTISTSHEEKEGRKTGFDMKSVAYIWHAFHKQMNIHVDIATPLGGETTMDPNIIDLTHDDPIVQDFLNDQKSQEHFHSTLPLANLNPNDYCLVVLPGGHGCLIDFPKSKELIKFMTQYVAKDWLGQLDGHKNEPQFHGKEPRRGSNAVIATVGHGLSGLLHINEPSLDRLPTTNITSWQKQDSPLGNRNSIYS